MDNFNYILNLDKLIKPCKVVKVPGIGNTTHDGKRLHTISYIVKNKHNIFKVRFTSEESNFNTLYSFDLCDKKFTPEYGLKFDNNTPPDKFFENIKLFLNDIKFKDNYKLKAVRLFESVRDIKIKLAVILPSIGYMTLAIITVFSFLRYWIRRTIMWKEFTDAEGKAEEEINEDLFNGQTGEESAFSIYNTTIKYISSVLTGNLKALFLCGPPGMSKTYIVRRTLHFSGLKPLKDYVIIKGSTLSPSDVYYMFYQYKNKIIILDDFDNPLKDENMINLLKSITDTYSKRIISLPREKKLASKGNEEMYDVPDKFEFYGKLIIITNIHKRDLDKSLVSRAPTIEVIYNTQEVLDNITKMMQYLNKNIPMDMKKEVYDYIVKLKGKDPEIIVDFRTFMSATELRYSLPDDWKDMVKVMVNYKG